MTVSTKHADPELLAFARQRLAALEAEEATLLADIRSAQDFAEVLEAEALELDDGRQRETLTANAAVARGHAAERDERLLIVRARQVAARSIIDGAGPSSRA